MQWLSSLGTLGSVLNTILLIVEVLLVFNLMILVHEWGHFLAARWRGLKVEAFYIWFGKPLWKKTINGVEYGLGSIPAGGFVKLPQMAPMGAIEGESTSTENLPPITPLDKIIVAFAGPLFSFLLAVFFAFLVMVCGKPQAEPFVTTTIGFVAEDSPAAKAGLKPGDKILTIDGEPIRKFEGFVDSVRWSIISSEGENIKFEVERDGQKLPAIAVSSNWPDTEKKETSWWKGIFERPALREVGIAGKEVPLVAGVLEHSPAFEAGLEGGDEILKINGQQVLHRQQIGEAVEASQGKPMTLLVRRTRMEKGAQVVSEFEKTLTPRVPEVWESTEDKPATKLGVIWDPKGRYTIAHPPVFEQVSDAARSMVAMIRKLVSGKSDISPAHMSGPVGIGRVYYNLLQDPMALLQVLWFSVVLNVNLAIMNMLPFPVLDGGHITMAVAQAIRRKPLHSRLLEVVQTACALMLFGFLIFVTLKDSGDIFLGGGDKGKGPSKTFKFLPPEERGAAKPATPAVPAGN